MPAYIIRRLLLTTLLGVTLLSGGCGKHQPATHSTFSRPKALPASPALFRNVVSAVGLSFQWGHASLQHINALETIGHGCAFLDFDGDGRLDILLVGSPAPHLYHQQPNGTFEDVTATALPPPPSHAHFLGCSVADYDGDGRPDILLTGYGRNALYHNEGNGTFRDVTAGSGLEARGPYDWTTSSAWADVDGDGKLDVYICRYVDFRPSSKQLCPYKGLDGSSILMACGPTTYPPQRGSLYHNDGHGHFRDVTVEAGLADTHGDGLGCLFCDMNGDGRPDLYIANDVKPCDLYINTGKGHFKEIGAESATAYGADGTVQSGMGVDWGDYDNDGRFDLLVANFAGQPKSLYHNEGNNLFTNVSYASGIGAGSITELAFGASFVDVDNDGLLDIVFTNGHVQSEVEKVDSTTSYFQSSQLYHNLGGGKFTDMTAQAGPDMASKIVGRGLAVGDYDGDGRQDLLIVNDEGAPMLLHNESRDHNHWLALDCLLGPDRWYAVGAQVRITTSGGHQIAEVRAGGSYLSANSPRIHFGLGQAAKADAIEIRWLNGHIDTWHDLAADHVYRIEPGKHPVPTTP
jgi:hypothetical protein